MALALFLDRFQALLEPDPLAHEGFGLQVLIAVVAAWISAFVRYRVIALLRRQERARG